MYFAKRRSRGGKMKVIIPVAGIGSRLVPQTHTLPKVLLPVAGKPMLGHILDKILNLKDISEVIFIIGYMGSLVKEYVEENYDFNCSFVGQTERNGLGHAIYLAKKYFDENIDESVLIVLGDTLFDIELSELAADDDGVIAVKKVEDPKRFGIAEINDKGNIISLVEKPEDPVSNLAIIGLYYFKNSKMLFESLKYIIENNIKTKNEFQLTDAMIRMLELGAKLKTKMVENWYDCGKAETLLETNRHLLTITGNKCYGNIINSVIIPPVNISPGTTIENSVIGPFVSLTDSVVQNSIISNAIINKDCTIKFAVLTSSLMGQNVTIIKTPKRLNIGDSSQYISKS